MVHENKIQLARSNEGDATELSHSRGKGLQALSTEPAQGITIVPDGQVVGDQGPGPVVSASEAAAGPADFDG